MKRIAKTATAAAIVSFGLALSPAVAQDRPGATPPKTMGDEGKLPATDSMTGQVPEMGATTVEPNTATPPRPGATAPKTMGDEGKLPATKSMGGQVPEMKP
jgi:hypothetical protein